MGRKCEFTIESYQFKVEPRDMGGHYATHKNPRYDVFLIASDVKHIGTCMTISEGFSVALDYVKRQKQDM